MHDYVLLNKRSAVQRSQVPCESQLGSDVKTSGGKTENSKGGEAGRLRRLQGPGPCAWALASRSPNGTVCRWVQWARGGRLDADSGVVLMQPGDGSDLHRKGAEWKPTNQETSLL